MAYDEQGRSVPYRVGEALRGGLASAYDRSKRAATDVMSAAAPIAKPVADVYRRGYEASQPLRPNPSRIAAGMIEFGKGVSGMGDEGQSQQVSQPPQQPAQRQAPVTNASTTSPGQLPNRPQARGNVMDLNQQMREVGFRIPETYNQNLVPPNLGVRQQPSVSQPPGAQQAPQQRTLSNRDAMRQGYLPQGGTVSVTGFPSVEQSQAIQAAQASLRQAQYEAARRAAGDVITKGPKGPLPITEFYRAEELRGMMPDAVPGDLGSFSRRNRIKDQIDALEQRGREKLQAQNSMALQQAGDVAAMDRAQVTGQFGLQEQRMRDAAQTERQGLIGEQQQTLEEMRGDQTMRETAVEYGLGRAIAEENARRELEMKRAEERIPFEVAQEYAQPLTSPAGLQAAFQEELNRVNERDALRGMGATPDYARTTEQALAQLYARTGPSDSTLEFIRQRIPDQERFAQFLEELRGE